MVDPHFFDKIAKVPDLEECDTYEGWRLEGYCIRKGSKAVAFNKRGQALFSIDQVTEEPDFDNSIPWYGWDD